ncbi:MAG: PAM68 family protein [Verrucomicrobia bacterium]|nr:PAM68 family protein [Leptolyngbya sp. ES-bin-22]
MAAKKKKAPSNAASANKEAADVSPLPFEPVSTRQKQAKQAPSTPVEPGAVTPAKQPLQGMPNASSIPEIVNRRMVTRAAFFSGVPTTCALLTFVVSYFAIANAAFQPPTAAVLLVSLGFFGLGVLGLSYGPLSASWDEERVGNLFGWDEFKLNFGRLRHSWRAAKGAKDETDNPSA